MPSRKRSFGNLKVFLVSFFLPFLAVLALPQTASGQGLEVNGAYAHVTGDFGTDGFNVGAAWWFTKHVTIAGDYESSWDTTTLGNFAFTNSGIITVHSHLQSALFGPRIFFSTKWTDKYKLNPFGEAEFGVSHLSQTINQQIPNTSVSASDSAFSWMLGGGLDYKFTSHFSGRANFDFLRTHLANQGQSRFRLLLGLAYTFGSR